MNHKIYSLKNYQVYRDNNNEPLNVPIISGDIDKIIKELKNNKGYHMFLKPDTPYILFCDLDNVPSFQEVLNIMDVIASQLNIDVSKIKYSSCTKTTDKGDVFSLHLSIPSMNATLAQQEQIFKDIRNIDPLKFDYIDLAVYKKYRWFRLPYQTMKEKPIFHSLVKSDMKDFILDYIPDGSINIQSSDFTIKGKKMFKYDKNIKFNVSDENIVYILNSLPPDYLDYYIKWLTVTNVLKWLNLKVLWESWSMQSSHYNEYKNNKIWRSIKDIKFDLNYLINIINKKTNTKMEYLQTFKEFEPLEYNYSPIYANNYRVSNIYTYDDFKETKTAIIQSCTGTGKTTAIAKHMKEYISHDDTNIYKLLSIFNLKTLGAQHYKTFKDYDINLSSYEDGFKRNEHF